MVIARKNQTFSECRVFSNLKVMSTESLLQLNLNLLISNSIVWGLGLDNESQSANFQLNCLGSTIRCRYLGAR